MSSFAKQLQSIVITCKVIHMHIDPTRLYGVIQVFFGSQRKFAELVGVHESIVSYWLNGHREPTWEQLQTMAHLGINLQYLANESEIPYSNLPEGEKLKAIWDHDRVGVMEGAIARWSKRGGRLSTDGTTIEHQPGKRMDRSIEIGKITKDIPTAADITIPLHWQSVPAGDLAPIVTESFDEFNITKRYANTFAVYIRGESMVGAGIEDGDIAVFKEGMAPREGQVVYACVNNMCTVKVYTVAPDGHVVLTPANEKYQPIDVKDGDVLSIRGVMVNLVREPKPYREPKSHSKK